MVLKFGYRSLRSAAPAVDCARESPSVFARAAYENRHCTGTGLPSFFECSLFPSSSTSHESFFLTGGAVSFGPDLDGQGHGGAWQQNRKDSLSFQIHELVVVVAEFEGRGIGGGCFEGVTRVWTSPGVLSPYVSPYEVCPL